MIDKTCHSNRDRIWAYCRDSGGDEQQDSVASQRRAIEDYARRHNVAVVQVFTDEARPGSTTVGRDGWRICYTWPAAIEPVDGIIFWSFSRLAREQLAAQFIKSDLRLRGYLLHSMMDDVPYGEFAPVVEALIDWKNERYLKDLSRDVKRGLHDLTQKGFAPGGFPPRGYKPDRVEIGAKRDGKPHIVSRWVPDPELAPRVRQAFQMRANGASYQEILETTRIYPVRAATSPCSGTRATWASRNVVTWRWRAPLSHLWTVRPGTRYRLPCGPKSKRGHVDREQGSSAPGDEPVPPVRAGQVR